MLVGIEFLLETQGPKLRKELLANFEKYSDNSISEDILFLPIDHLRSKAILMIVVVLFVVVIVLMMFIKNITDPLQHMIETAKKISKGDLSQTIKISTQNELAELGNTINEMSSNLQEITLLSKNLCQTGNVFIAHASTILVGPLISQHEIKSLNKNLELFKSELIIMESMIRCFNFYSSEDNTDD